MGRPGDVVLSSPVIWSSKPSPPPHPSGPGHSKAWSSSNGDYSFFRTRPQRSSETGGSSLDSTPASPISPLTFPTQNNPKKVERQTLIRSDATLTLQLRPNVDTSASDLQTTNLETIENQLLGVRPPRTSQIARCSDYSSSAASVGADKSSKLPVVRIPTNATKNGQPPRDAKHGHKWKQEISGHWLEIRLGRNSRPNDSLAVSGEAIHPTTHSAISSLPLGDDQWRNTNDTLSGHLSASSDTILSRSATTSSQEGLYCRAKRHLGLKKSPLDTIRDEPLLKSPTVEMLEQASDVLREYAEKTKTQEETSSITTTNMSIAGTRSGLSRFLQPYRRSASSTSSSVRNMLMGKAPEPTPDPEAMYRGSDANTYFRTEIADPEGLTFLPSEARRLDTPPLSHGHRGSYFHYSKLREETNNSLEHGAGSSFTPGGSFRKRKSSDLDWYKLKEAADEARDEQARIELDVPEHLPNSPLCPRNPKHKSGGKGVCVYHGRNERLSLTDEMRDRQ